MEILVIMAALSSRNTGSDFFLLCLPYTPFFYFLAKLNTLTNQTDVDMIYLYMKETNYNNFNKSLKPATN